MNIGKSCRLSRRSLQVVTLLGAGAIALALSATPAAARVDVFVGATFGIPLPAYPVYYSPPPYYPPPAAYYYPTTPAYYAPAYRGYGPRWKHGPHWKQYYRNCHRCGGGYCR